MLVSKVNPIEADWPIPSLVDEGPTGAWHACVDLAYARRAQQTIPTVRRHVGPLRVLKGYRQSGDDCWEQVLVHPPGGIAGNDRLDIRVRAEQSAQVLITTPGASKWYRSGESATSKAPPGALQTVNIQVAGGSGFEWLPLENIFYDGAVARLDSHFDVAPDAALITADVYCLGRPASNAPFERGCLEITTRITRSNKPLFIERARLSGGSRALTASAGLDRHPCFGNLIALPAQAGGQQHQPDSNDQLSELRDLVRIKLSEQAFEGEFAVTTLPEVLLVRWRGPSAEAGWQALRTAWRALRNPVLGRAAQEPRIWAC